MLSVKRLFTSFSNNDVITWNFALLGLCVGNHRPPMEHNGPVIISFSALIFFKININIQLNVQSGCRWFERPWHSWEVTVAYLKFCGVIYASVNLVIIGLSEKNVQNLCFHGRNSRIQRYEGWIESAHWGLRPFLLTGINFNPSMEK